jgi:hypothetical protein
MAKGMPVDLSELPPSCKHCILGKQTRTPVPKTRTHTRSTRKLGVVYADLTGPEAVESKRRNFYSMELVDEYTDMTWCIPLRTKDRAFPELKRWENERRQECREDVGIYRVDGGELKRDYFVETAGYIAQRRPMTYQRNKTPYEAWYNEKPDLSHLREIGCQAFVLIQNKHNPKIFDHSLECQLIGYSADSKAYICYHKLSCRVLTSYHVKFIESHQTIPKPLQPGRIVNVEAEIPTHSPPTITVDDNQDDDNESEELPTQPVPNPEEPVPSAPCRSGRVPGESVNDRLRRAMEEAKDAGERVKANREAKRQGYVPNENDAHALIDAITLHALTADESQLNLEYPDDPKSAKEALESQLAHEWLAAMHEELNSIKEMGVYVLVPRSVVPKGRKVMRGKFVFRTKRDFMGAVARYKARYVLLGHQMIYGKDYTKTTSPTACAESLHILFHLAAAMDFELTQIDVKTAYLYGAIDETTWMEQPKGFEEPGREDWVWELKKGLYGMKQGGRLWNKHMDTRMKTIGFTQLSVEHCIYYHKWESGTIFAAVHVDDFTVAASSIQEEQRFEEELGAEWQISRADANFIVGWAVRRDRLKHTVYLSQKALIDRVVAEYGCKDANPVKTPLPPNTRLTKRDLPQTEEEGQRAAAQLYRQLVGVLMYLAISTRPDIMHAISTLSRFNSGHGDVHWKAALHVVRYLKGTRDYELELGGSKEAELIGYTDSDYANCPDTRRLVSGYCFSLGSGIVSWMSKKQATTATSSTEAEYMAACSATKEAVWIRNLLHCLNQEQRDPTVIFIDNNGARILTEDPSFHQRAKHIETQHHYSRECAQRGIVHFVDIRRWTT